MTMNHTDWQNAAVKLIKEVLDDEPRVSTDFGGSDECHFCGKYEWRRDQQHGSECWMTRAEKLIEMVWIFQND